MRYAVARTALTLALLQPALHAQLSLSGLTRWYTYKGKYAWVSFYEDESHNCWVYRYTLTGFITLNTPLSQAQIIQGPHLMTITSADGQPKPMSCSTAAISFHLGRTSSARWRQSPVARSDAASTSATELIWIGSDTPPSATSTAPAAVYAVDPSTFNTVAAIPLAGGPSASPIALIANNAGTYVYAVISPLPLPGLATIVAIDTSSYSITQTIDLPQGVNPGIPALSPDDRYLYVPNSGTGGGVLVIDTQNPSSITTIPTAVTYPKLTEVAGVAQAAVSPDGQLLFAWGSYNIFVIDTATAQQIGQILLPAEQGGQPLQSQQNTGANYFVIDPTGSRIYAFANYGSGPSNTWTGYLYAYDTATLAQVGSVELAQNVDLDNIAITADGSTVFLNSFVYADGQNPTFAIDAQSLAVTQANPAAPSVSLGDGFWQTLLGVLQ